MDLQAINTISDRIETADGGEMGNNTSSDALGKSSDGAEPQYVRVKTSVWWVTQVPTGCKAHTIAQNISSSLVKVNYCGPISVS